MSHVALKESEESLSDVMHVGHAKQKQRKNCLPITHASLS